VIGICSLALLSFYSSKVDNIQKLSSFGMLQDSYSSSDFAKYSGSQFVNKYPEISLKDGKGFFVKSYSVKKGFIFTSEVEVMKVSYLFDFGRNI
jgi:hypothetical protein